MSDKKKDTADKADDDRTAGETAKRLLLAGIGAYGRAFMEAQEALKDVRGKSSDVFDDLVQKGEMMEIAFEHKTKTMMEKSHLGGLSVPNVDLSNFKMDDRIKKMRARLTRHNDDEDAVMARLAAVEAKLDKLTTLVESSQAMAKRPNRKTAPKKKTATKTKLTPSPKKA